jgi:hypothetical protein
MALELNGTTGVQGNSGAFVAGTAVAATSGTSITFTSIPSWVQRITVMFDGVSTNGSSNIIIRIGTSSGIVSTGYAAATPFFSGGSSSAILTYTDGFNIAAPAAPGVLRGTLRLCLLNATTNSWVADGVIYNSGNAYGMFPLGNITLASVLTQVAVTMANGTDTFDAGTINILYE